MFWFSEGTVLSSFWGGGTKFWAYPCSPWKETAAPSTPVVPNDSFLILRQGRGTRSPRNWGPRTCPPAAAPRFPIGAPSRTPRVSCLDGTMKPEIQVYCGKWWKLKKKMATSHSSTSPLTNPCSIFSGLFTFKGIQPSAIFQWLKPTAGWQCSELKASTLKMIHPNIQIESYTNDSQCVLIHFDTFWYILIPIPHPWRIVLKIPGHLIYSRVLFRYTLW